MAKTVLVMCSCGGQFQIASKSRSRNMRRNGGVYRCLACAVRSPTYRERHSKALSRAMNRPDLRNAMRDRAKAPEIRAKLSESTTAMWQNPAFKSRIVDCIRRRSNDAAWQQRQSILRTSDAFRASIGASIKRAMNRPDVATRHLAAMRRPETIRKLSEASKAFWRNPQHRAAMSAMSLACWQRDDYRESHALARSEQPRISSLQLTLYTMLDGLGISYERESEATRRGHYVFDCAVPFGGRTLLIECQGEYWHTLPGAASRDAAKFTYIDRYFPDHEIMYVWEHEFMAEGRVLDRLKLKLGIEVQTVEFEFADITVVPNPSFDSVKQFLSAYHYLRGTRAGRAVSFMHGDVLVGVVLFSKPLRQNMGSTFPFAEFVELSRLCIHPSYHRRNFASWLISRAVKLVDLPIVSYADTTVGHRGTVYRASNFTLHHEVPPDYWYVDGQGYVTGKRAMYGQAVKMRMKEAEYAALHNMRKQWGGKKLCFIYVPR